jgi:hypothetical protein
MIAFAKSSSDFIQPPSPSRTKQPRTVAIQRRIGNLYKRYYDGLIHPMEYLDGLSVVVKRKKMRFFLFLQLLTYT